MTKQLKIVKLKDIVPYENNPRHNDQAVDAVKESIKQCEYIAPIIVDENMIILAGHTRHKALKALGKKEAEVMIVSGLTDDQKRKYRLLDNKTNELAEWDIDLLEVELDDLDFEGYDFGFDIEQIEPEPEVEEDDYTETNVETRCKLGDLWQLGDHRLICGDSTDANIVDRLMGGQQADLLLTDPPYGVQYTGGMRIEDGKIKSNEKEQIKNDALDYNNLYYFLYDAFINAMLYLKDRSALYVFYAHSRSREFLNAFYDAGLKQRSIIIWHKIGGGFGDFMAQYMNAYEPCIYGSKGEAVNWYGATNEKTVWDVEKETKCDLHPTMKPIALCSRAIKNSSKQGDGVLDLFGGSGSTLIACEQLNRKCYMCELDEHYCDVIIDRWEQFTGRKAVLLNE